MKSEKFFIRVGSYLSFLLLAFFLSSCITHRVSSNGQATNHNQYVLNEKGLPDLLEIGMTTGDLAERGLKLSPMPGREFLSNGFKISSLGTEFELENKKIKRIWFFVHKYGNTNVQLIIDNKAKNLSDITVVDIIRNFGAVKKYFNQNPPKPVIHAYWLKYSPFGIKVNTISYPRRPFFFGFDDDDNLTYVTIFRAAI
jgi:hypothetical protein